MVGCAFTPPAPAADAATFREKILYSFGNTADAAQPYDGLIKIKGRLYGTTYAGGDFFNGSVFSLDLYTGAEKVLYSFHDNSEANLIDVKGTLYGTTVGGDSGAGTVFAFDPKRHEEKTAYIFCNQVNCVDGAFPVAGLINVRGMLYGTTLGGGASGITACNNFGCGAAFSLDPKTGMEKVLYSFCGQQNCADGRWPMAGLIDMNGMLYGTAANGGVPGCHQNLGCGTVFSIDPNIGGHKTLYTFCSQQNCADGANPFDSLIAVNGMLYGTTYCGGGYGADTECFGRGYGTVFSIDPNSGTEKALHSFGKGEDGRSPQAGLIAVNGLLYGTTAGGGGKACGGEGCGTVYSLDPSTGAETVLYSFRGRPDGQWPNELIGVKGRLYGTTIFGGANGNGTVFALEKRH